MVLDSPGARVWASSNEASPKAPRSEPSTPLAELLTSVTSA